MNDIVIWSGQDISSKLIQWDSCFDKKSKTVLPEVHAEGVEGDDSGAGHHRQEGGEPGKAGLKGHTQAPAIPVSVLSTMVECQFKGSVLNSIIECQ